MKKRRVVLLAFLGLAALQSVQGLQVFLQSLTVHVVHRIKPLEGNLGIFFQCDGGDRVSVPNVQEQDTPYSWPSEDLPITTLSRGGCKHCSFYEDRKLPLVPDDRLGDPFQLCTSDFGQSGEDYVVRQEQAASFEASFFCGECAPLPPPPPPSPPPLPPPPPFPPPAPLVEEALADGSTAVVDETTHRRGLGVLAIVGIAVGATALVSCVSAVVGMSVLRYYRRKWADQRARAFEAVFSDPDLDLEEVAAEDARNSKGWGWMQLASFTRLRDTQVSNNYNEGF